MSKPPRRKATETVKYNFDDDDTPKKIPVKKFITKAPTEVANKENIEVVVEAKKKSRKPKKIEVAQEESDQEKLAEKLTKTKNAAARPANKKVSKIDEAVPSESEDELIIAEPSFNTKSAKSAKKAQEKPAQDNDAPAAESSPKGKKRGAAGKDPSKGQVEELEIEDEEPKPAAKKARTAKVEPLQVMEEAPSAPRKTAPAKGKKGKGKLTQEDDDAEEAPSAPRKTVPAKGKKGKRAQEDDDAEDTMLDRELEETRKSLEQLVAKYDNLKNLRITEAERNFQEYKKTAEARFKSSDDMIAQLKHEKEQLESKLEAMQNVPLKAVLKQQQPVRKDDKEHDQEGREREKEWVKNQEMLETEVEELKKQVSTLEKECIAEIENSKSLAARLAKAPKPATNAGSSEQPLPVEQRRAREITLLHGDLSGLLVRDVKVSPDGEIAFDCLESGNNGTVHFKLIQPADKSDTLMYRPILDSSRDADLIALLPDYLSENIEFTRKNASMFFWRLLDFLQKPKK